VGGVWHGAEGQAPVESGAVRYTVRFDLAARRHLRSLTARERRLALETIEVSPRSDAERATRNRKLTEPGLPGPWKL